MIAAPPATRAIRRVRCAVVMSYPPNVSPKSHV
jgi:hypothetical protein